MTDQSDLSTASASVTVEIFNTNLPADTPAAVDEIAPAQAISSFVQNTCTNTTGLILTAEEQELIARCARIRDLIATNQAAAESELKQLAPEEVATQIRTGRNFADRQLKNIGSTNQFTKFLRLCAGRTGQLLNINALSIDSGLDMRTVQAWLSILESSYIIYLLKPHATNYNKRLVKTSKLYFHDTGLACSLLGIKTVKELELSHFRGALFENAVINEIQKQNANSIKSSELFFWRDNKGVEIDLLKENGSKKLPIEIKASQTFHTEYFKNINYWNRLSGNKTGRLVYGGDKSFELPGKMSIQSWREIEV